MSVKSTNTALRFQKYVAFLAIILFALKLIAWYLTKSVAVFTDAMESTVNVVTGIIGWYSLWLASQPQDLNHPNGHGKAEFISSGIEGTLISVAGIAIIYEAIQHFIHPMQQIARLDSGMILLGVTSILNYAAGTIAIKKGKETHSIALQAGGRHLRTDTYSTIGIIIGLLLIRLTGWHILDPIVALIFAAFILVTGYQVVRNSLKGIMDETDMGMMQAIIRTLNDNRKREWIDVHNFRMIQYGNMLHLDGHLTLPWYYNVRQAHAEMEQVNQLINSKFEGSAELFVHVDACVSYSCHICQIDDCPVRKHPFTRKVDWTIQNVLANHKHGNDTE